MTKFNTYARRLDETARKIFDELQSAERTFKAAEDAKAHGPRPGGWQDARTKARIAALEADLVEAQAALQAARRTLSERGEKALQGIRLELEKAIDTAATVDPGQVDTAAVALLDSGICTATDLEKLMDDAGRAGNNTMIRLIAAHAEKLAVVSESQPDRVRLTALAQRTPAREGAALLAAFDGLTDVFQRTVNNTAMIGHWESLTADAIEGF